jgi:hypothetical protein
MIYQRNVITIATGKKLYIDFAANLARSFFLHNSESDIHFYIVTDNKDLIDADILKKVSIIETSPGELGEGFSSKLHLDKLAPEGQTLFIDSDCLIFGNLDQLFNKFKGHSVSVVGDYISQGEWFGDVEKICKKFKVPHFPKFNGGIYYLEKGDNAIAVYTKARELEKEYDEIGFIRLRNTPNDEVIMALAMQIHNQKVLLDDGTILSDPQACQGGYEIDVIAGKCWLYNPPKPHPLHQEWYKFERVFPLIFHFLGDYTDHYPYKSEVYKLKHKRNCHTKFYVKVFIEYPMRLKIKIKQKLRPVYRRLVGVRKVKKSGRF